MDKTEGAGQGKSHRPEIGHIALGKLGTSDIELVLERNRNAV